MHRGFLVLPFLATGLYAQGLVPPATLRGMQKVNGLSTPAVPGAGVEQIHMVRLPGDPPGTYTTALTVRTLPSMHGGMGAGDILTGKYDIFTDTFTPDLNAASLNAAGEDFGFMIHHTGLIAVWDRLSTIEVATRPSLTSPWTRKGSVTGLPTAPGYFDPAVAQLNGQLILLYVTGSAQLANIAYSTLDINTLAAGPSVTVVRANRTTGQANSPTPIVTSTGELVAISHHDVVGVDNDHYVSFDLDPNTPSVLFIDNPNWKNNGGFAAGTFFDATSAPAPYHVYSVESAWWTGGRAAIGTNMEITANIPPVSSGPPMISFAVLAPRGFLSTPTQVLGINGLLGIDPTLLLILGLGGHITQTGEARTNVGVPNDPSLRGAVIPGQVLTVDAANNKLHLGNTAALTILP